LVLDEKAQQIYTLGTPHYKAHFSILRKLKDFNTFRSGMLRLKSSSLHVSLCRNISANDCARELFKP